MIKIAFCDNDRAFLDGLSTLSEQYQLARNTKIHYATFQNPADLLSEAQKGTAFSIVFLETIFPDTTGIRVATELQSYQNNVKIIFLTASSVHAVSSYGVDAFYYQLKPISKEIFFDLMDSALLTSEAEKPESLVLHCKDGITRIYIPCIEYCEVIHRTLFIHLVNGQVLESIGSMDHLYTRLEPYGCFLRPHRSYIINLSHVRGLSSHGISMSGQTEIPLPRGKHSIIKGLYLEYAQREGFAVM